MAGNQPSVKPPLVYRKKHADVEAIRLTTDNGREIEAWVNASDGRVSGWSGHLDGRTFQLSLWTPYGTKYADVGDWIVRDAHGVFDTLNHIAFDASYEPAVVHS